MSDPHTQPIDADRPFLEQFEEQALYDDDTLQYLIEEIYPNREIMAILTELRPAPVQSLRIDQAHGLRDTGVCHASLHIASFEKDPRD
jgi:hypothetical protein